MSDPYVRKPRAALERPKPLDRKLLRQEWEILLDLEKQLRAMDARWAAWKQIDAGR